MHLRLKHIFVSNFKINTLRFWGCPEDNLNKHDEKEMWYWTNQPKIMYKNKLMEILTHNFNNSINVGRIINRSRAEEMFSWHNFIVLYYCL